jgi:hypothetical protein
MDPDPSEVADSSDDRRDSDDVAANLTPIEVLLFAPLGLVLKAGELLPGLVESGRREYNKRAVVARFMGKLIVDQQRKKRQAAVVRTVGSRTLSGDRPAVVQPNEVQPTEVEPNEFQPNEFQPNAVEQPASPQSDASLLDPSGPTPDVGSLPIDGYDTLPARSLLGLFDGLSLPQLATVLAYEQAHRQRATIMNRLRELLK